MPTPSSGARSHPGRCSFCCQSALTALGCAIYWGQPRAAPQPGQPGGALGSLCPNTPAGHRGGETQRGAERLGCCPGTGLRVNAALRTAGADAGSVRGFEEAEEGRTRGHDNKSSVEDNGKSPPLRSRCPPRLPAGHHLQLDSVPSQRCTTFPLQKHLFDPTAALSG